jgi:hypothetical protein
VMPRQPALSARSACFGLAASIAARLARESCGCRWAAACGGGWIKVIAALGFAV